MSSYPKGQRIARASAARVAAVETLLNNANAVAAAPRRPPIPDAHLSFKNGRFSIRGRVVPLGTRYVANVPSLRVGWIKMIEEGRVLARRDGRPAAGFKAPTRRELGDRDVDYWPWRGRNRYYDPWRFFSSMVLIDEAVGDAVTYTTTNGPEDQAVRELVGSYGCHLRVAPNELPIITLGVKDGKPELDIVGWCGHYAPAPINHETLEEGL